MTGRARAPQGRFHHSGQPALYASLSREGAAVAIRRYLHSDDTPRVIVPLKITAHRVVNLRDSGEATAAAIIWQDIVTSGRPSPTWRFSDAARTAGAQGLLYASRSRPDLSHIVLFDFDSAVILPAGPPETWQPPY